MTTVLRKLRTLLCFALAGVAGLAFATPSHAGPLVNTAVSCGSYRYEQPFDRWVDPFSYVLVPDGNFERRPQGWNLTGRARVVAGNERYYVHRRGERSSLRLQGNAVATSPAMCVQATVVGGPQLYPTIRFFARNMGASSSGLKVEILFEDVGGNVQPLQIGVLTGSETWEPTIPVLLVATLLPNLGDPLLGESAVAFRFSLQGNSGDWRIDDVYLDPYRHR